MGSSEETFRYYDDGGCRLGSRLVVGHKKGFHVLTRGMKKKKKTRKDSWPPPAQALVRD